MTMEEERPNDHPQLPPGFRFHPTDEELLIHYLKKKVSSSPQPVSIIADVDLYKFDPWDLPGLARFGEKEWYFFSPRDRKYPNGARPNRAARSGYWKATGTDKPVLISGTTHKVGVKKALVFYTGRPPKGSKTNWIMHEYRLTDTAPAPPRRKGSLRLDDWVLCRIYKKLGPFLRMEGSEGEAEDSLGESMGVPTTMAAAAGQQAYQWGPKFDSFTGLLQIEEQANFLDGFLETSDANGGLPRQGMAYNDSVSSKLNSLKRNPSLVFTDEIEDLYTSSPSSKKPTNHTNNFSSASASINGSNLLKATMGSYTDLQQLYTLPPYADNGYWSTDTGQPWLTWTT